MTHSELRNRLGLMGHDQRRQWEHVKKRVSLFADVEVVSRRVPRKAGGEGSSSEKCFSFAERPAPPPARLGGMQLDVAVHAPRRR